MSSQGHLWATAANVTAYGEKMVPSAYADKRASVDGEETDEPVDGFLWDLAARHRASFRDYGGNGRVRRVAGDAAGAGSGCQSHVSLFNLKISDQTRADAWIADSRNGFVRVEAMPSLEVMHLANDHFAAARGVPHTARLHGRQ